MRPHPSFWACSHQNGSVSKIPAAALSIISDGLLHLCYLRSDIMLMCHPLASRPLCSLPVIRLDYALLDVNAFSANKFTMSIIIFRCSSAGKGEGGRGGGGEGGGGRCQQVRSRGSTALRRRAQWGLEPDKSHVKELEV